MAWDHPDPDNIQYDQMVSAGSLICKQHRIVASDLYIFLDYCSIPQKNIKQRRNAIDSLGVFSSICHLFVVIAPTSTHKDTKLTCDKLSYGRRGWCRLEQWGHMCMMGMDDMFFFKEDILRDLDETPSNKESKLHNSIDDKLNHLVDVSSHRSNRETSTSNNNRLADFHLAEASTKCDDWFLDSVMVMPCTPAARFYYCILVLPLYAKVFVGDFAIILLHNCVALVCP